MIRGLTFVNLYLRRLLNRGQETGRKSLLPAISIIFSMILIIAPIAAAQQSAQTSFFNPVYEHADPYITYVNGDYYILTTNQDVEVLVTKATSIAGLASATPVGVWNTSNDSGFESPELHWDPTASRWYLYYTVFNNYTSYVLESDTSDAQGTYHMAGTLCTECYDVTTLTMTDGTLYLLGVENSQIFAQLMTNPYTVSGSPTTIGTVTQSWEHGEVEDPWPVWHNGQLSIVYSSNAFNSGSYALGLMKYNGNGVTNASSWVKVQGPIFGGSNSGAEAFGAGTFTSFSSPDGTQLWFTFNAYRRNDFSSDTREVRVQPLTWNTDNTPNLGSIIPLTTAILLPSGDPGVPANGGIYPGAWYRVFNQNAQICLDDSGGAITPGTNVELWTCNGASPQNWQTLPSTTANGWYKIINQTAGLALDDQGGGTSPGANVDLWTDNFLDTQRWNFSDAGSGYLGVTIRQANLVLDDEGGGITPGTNVDLWTNYNHLNTQNWLFAPIPQSGLFYKIVNLTSQLCVDDAGSGKSPGTIVDQSTCTAGANQYWQLQSMGSGWFRLVNQNSGLCLDDPAGSTAPGTLLKQWTCDGASPQNWQLIDVGNGYYNLLNQAANLMLDDPAGSITSGVQLQLWTSNNASSQSWRLVLP